MNRLNTPLVTIITPSFNQGAFIEQTIVSVLQQTYKPIEYIIIDGGSTDNTVEIIKKYADKLTYWVSEKDNGQADAINKGLEHASGKIVAYLNSDDVYEPDAVETIVAAFTTHPNKSIIYGKCTNIDEKGTVIGKSQGSNISYFQLLTGTMLPSIHQPACFFNLSVLNRKPLFDNSLTYGMDYDLLLWSLRKQEPLFIDRNIAFFRYHSLSKTVSQTSTMYEEKMRIQRKHNKWLYPLWIWRYVKHQLSSLRNN
jgi:glycosyltransferase involved in cell wall biosynthesis